MHTSAAILRVATALHLLEFFWCAPLLFETNAAGERRSVPTTPLLPALELSPSTTLVLSTILCAAASTFALATLLRGHEAIRRKATALSCVSAWTAVVCLLSLQVSDLTRAQCWVQVVTGMFLAFGLEDCDWSDDDQQSCFERPGVYPAGVMVSAQWTWAGLHKLNPNFVFGFQELLDPIVHHVLGQNEPICVAFRVLGTVLEALSGCWLLYLFTAGRALSSVNSRIARWVWVPSAFLAQMHCILITRLVQIGWARGAWGWNVFNGICACVFYAEVSRTALASKHYEGGPATTENGRHCGFGVKNSKAVLTLYVAYFALMPSLLLSGHLPSFLCHGIYTNNIPEMPFVQVQATSPEALARILPQAHRLVFPPQQQTAAMAKDVAASITIVKGTAAAGVNHFTALVNFPTRVYAELRVVYNPWLGNYDAGLLALLGRTTPASHQDSNEGECSDEEQAGKACLAAVHLPMRLLSDGFRIPPYDWVHVCRSADDEEQPRKLQWSEGSGGGNSGLNLTQRLLTQYRFLPNMKLLKRRVRCTTPAEKVPTSSHNVYWVPHDPAMADVLLGAIGPSQRELELNTFVTHQIRVGNALYPVTWNPTADFVDGDGGGEDGTVIRVSCDNDYETGSTNVDGAVEL